MKITAKEFFLEIGAMLSLYIGIGALLNLLFSVIDTAYPPVTSYYYNASTISMPVAILIVTFPLFILLSWLIERSAVQDPGILTSGLRRFIVYGTLFVSGGIIAGDLVVLIYKFLDGQDLTAAFLLKVLAIFVVLVSVFAYFLSELWGRLTHRTRMVWRIYAAIIVIGSIVLGFSVIGSPKTQRLMRIDEQKVSDLQMIQSQVENYYQMKRVLPGGLSELTAANLYGNNVPLDPETKQPYEYERTADLGFRLCANFNLPTRNTPTGSTSMIADGGLRNSSNWVHGAGRQCFERTIDPDFYPPIKR